MCTFDQVSTLYTYIQQKFFTKDDWPKVNVSLSEYQQKESIVNEMVESKFGGYRKYSSIYIGSKKYRVKVLPKQNKFNRPKNQYHHVEAAENFVNIMVYKYNPNKDADDTMLNIHIVLQTLASENAKARKAEKAKVDADGFQTA